MAIQKIVNGKSQELKTAPVKKPEPVVTKTKAKNNKVPDKYKDKLPLIISLSVFVIMAVIITIMITTNTDRKHYNEIRNIVINYYKDFRTKGTNSEIKALTDEELEDYATGIYHVNKYLKIKPSTMLALGTKESRLYALADAGEGDGKGIYQVCAFWADDTNYNKLVTIKELDFKLTNSAQLWKVYDATLAGGKILSMKIKDNKGNLKNGLYAYNGGNPDKFKSHSKSFKEKKLNYLYDILTIKEEIEAKYGKQN